MTLESIEKLRELACDINGNEIVDHMQLYPSCVFDGAWLNSWHCKFDRELEALEREIAERYMELPVDTDGVPIRVGETCYDTDTAEPFEVSSIEWNGICWSAWSKPEKRHIYNYVTHIKPRTLEDVLHDSGVSIAAISDVAAEILSDCSTNANGPYDVARLRIEFEGEEIPWMYPLALNGRVIKGVFVDGERYERVRECVMRVLWCDDVDGICWICSECNGSTYTHGLVPVRCSNCGARVKEVSEWLE